MKIKIYKWVKLWGGVCLSCLMLFMLIFFVAKAMIIKIENHKATLSQLENSKREEICSFFAKKEPNTYADYRLNKFSNCGEKNDQ